MTPHYQVAKKTSVDLEKKIDDKIEKGYKYNLKR